MRTREIIEQDVADKSKWTAGLPGVTKMLALVVEVLLDIRDQKKDQA